MKKGNNKRDNKPIPPTHQVSITVSFTTEEISLRKRGTYTHVHFMRGVPLGKPGEPALPWRKIYIAVPWDAKPEVLSVETEHFTLLDKGVMVEPCQPDEPTMIGRDVTVVEPDQRLYSSDSIWPTEIARFTTVRRAGGFAMAEIEVCPFRYHMKDLRLELIQQLRLTLSYSQAGVRRDLPQSVTRLRYEQKFLGRVQRLVHNPHDVADFLSPLEPSIYKALPLFPEVDYVIVTNQALASEFQRLANWRTLLGLRSRVVTVEDIMLGTVPDTGGTVFNHTSGYTDGGTRDTAEAIRNFIKWASENWLSDYILLGGDTEIIPCRQAIHNAIGRVDYKDLGTPLVHKDYQLGRAPSASSELATTPASNVFDDDTTTAWQCDPQDNAPWIRVDIGLHTPVNCVHLNWGTTHAPAYKIQVSMDGTSWTDVYSTTAASGGNEEITFACASGAFVRLLITSGAGFALTGMAIYGPHRGWEDHGAAYQISPTLTRIYLGTWIWMNPNPTNSLEDDLLIITGGSEVGKVIPYDTNATDTQLGWHFVEDLLQVPIGATNNSTKFLEINGPAKFHGQSFVLKLDKNYIPADLYYADIAASEYPPRTHHDWDSDGNGIYGERYGGELDGVNGMADVIVGRVPAETSEHVKAYVNKTIRYERYTHLDEFGFEALMPADFGVSVLLGSQDWAHTNTAGALDGSASGKEDIRHMLLDYDSGRWEFTRLYQDHADVDNSDKTGDLAVASKDAIMAAIRAGNNVVSLSSHGSSGYLCYLNTNDLDDVVSDPAIFYGNACSTNKFDETYGEAISEMALLNSDGSAVGYVGNSRYGWTGDNPIELAFWEEMLDSGRLGEMFNVCKLVKLGWQSYSLNLLGDPAIRVWSDRPRQIIVDHAEDAHTGHQTFSVTVTSEGKSVSGALVCVTMPNTLFAIGFTNANGECILAVAPSVEGTMSVTVSGKNLIPYFGTVDVKKREDVCFPMVACSKEIYCGVNVMCQEAIYCGAAIVCGFDIFCGASIICTRLINCSQAIACGQQIFCSHNVGMCLEQVVCSGMIGDMCPLIRPDEFDHFRYVREIWGIHDMKELARQSESHEIKDTLRRLPDEISKPIRMMITRILEEIDDRQ